MTFLSVLRFYVPRLAFRRAAQLRLKAQFPAETAGAIWRHTLERHAALVPARPRHSLGVNLVVRYLEWDRALYQAVQTHGGMTPSQAGALIETIAWDIFGPPIGAGYALSRLRSGQRRRRVHWFMDLLFGVVFTSPFRRKVVPSADGVSFDVTRCPFAEYLQAQGTPELTKYAACDLDHRMAHDWGARLERSQTIATGASHCDFRFRMKSP
jgi:hypothetical protein